MKHKIKMIGLDLDGTLLDSKKVLTEYTRNVLQKALQQGLIVIASTGRALSAIPKELLSLQGMKYVITANGARVIDIQKNEVLIENTIPVETAEHMLDIIYGYDAVKEIFVEGKCYSGKKEMEHVYDYFDNPHVAEYVLHSRTHVEDVKTVLREINHPVEKVQGVFRHMDDRTEALRRLREIPGITITNAFGYNLEMNKEGTDKGNALLKLAETLGIKREEIMACGDGMNDYAMLKMAGIAVAMENACDELKEIADYITATNDEDGVAKAIEKFALQ